MGSLLEAQAISRAPILKDVSFAISAGERWSLTGPSGAGKSFLLRTVCLLEIPDHGQVLWNGSPVRDEQVPEFRSRVIYVPQRASFFPGTVEDNLRRLFSLRVHAARRYDREKILRWLDEFGRGEKFLAHDVKHLSGGESQIVSLLRALQLDPEVLCLDEPTSSMDSQTRDHAEALLTREFRGAWIWISHDPAQAERVNQKVLRTFL